MKTPEIIKDGLNHCSEDGCKGCPYVEDCNMADGFSELAKDALTYIRMLETELMLRCKTNYRYYIVNQKAKKSLSDELSACMWLRHEMYGEKRYVSEIDGMAYGWIEFTEPLSSEQIHTYGLISAPVE